jgi:O-antigen ligase
MEHSLDYQMPLKSRQRWLREVPAGSSSGPKVAFLLLVAFLILLYSNVGVIYKQYLEAFRPTFVIAVAALFMMVVENGQARQAFKLTWPQGHLLLALLGVCVISTFSSIYVRVAADQTADFAKIVLVYVLIENVVTTESRLKTVMWTMALCGLFPAVGTIYHYQTGIFVEGTRAAWRGIFGNPNEAAYGILVLIPIVLALAKSYRLSVKFVLWALIAVYLVAMFLTFSRGGFLTLFTVLGLAGWKHRSIFVKAGMVTALIAAIVVISTFWKRNSGDFKHVEQDTSFLERLYTFEAGAQMFLHNPLFGVGPGDSMVAYPLYAPIDAKTCGCHDQLHVHNSYIQALAELGASGFIPFILFISITTYQAWKMERGPLKDYATALGLSMWVFLVFSTSGGFVYTWWPYILVGLIVALKRIAGSTPAEMSLRGADAV